MAFDLPPVLPFFDTLSRINESNGFINESITNIVIGHVKDAGETYEHALSFLLENTHAENKFKTYRAELTSFFIWAFNIEGISLSKVQRPHIAKYIEWAKNPPKEFIGTSQVAQFILIKSAGVYAPNPKWRPFVKRAPKNSHIESIDIPYNLSPVAIQNKLSCLSSFFYYLNDVEYCDTNPAALFMRRKLIGKLAIASKSDNEIKALSKLQWSYVYSTAQDLTKEDPKYERTLFLLSLMYSCYLRISEVSARPGFSPVMSQFTINPQDNSWSFFVPQSKGGKSGKVMVSNELLNALKRYRLHLGMTELPSRTEVSPLFVRHVKGKTGRDSGIINANLGIRQVRSELEYVFQCASDKLLADNLEIDADEVKNSSAHTIRHTGITHDIENGRPLSHVQKDARHNSIETTSQYIGIRTAERYQSAINKELDELNHAK
jgi:site-specific recombinase XerD